jgi:hypothetical protein
MCETNPLGFNIACTPESANPIAGTGQILNATEDTSITVEPGVYVVTAVVGYVLLGFVTTATVANILWAATAGGPSIHVCIPENTTDLHYICVGSSPKAYIRKVYE